MIYEIISVQKNNIYCIF